MQGYDSTTVIYEGHLTSCPDTIKSHLQDLAKQHLRGEERRTPHLFEVTLNRGAPRLSYMCGGNPHYVAMAVDRETTNGDG